MSHPNGLGTRLIYRKTDFYQAYLCKSRLKERVKDGNSTRSFNFWSLVIGQKFDE